MRFLTTKSHKPYEFLKKSITLIQVIQKYPTQGNLKNKSLETDKNQTCNYFNQCYDFKTTGIFTIWISSFTTKMVCKSLDAVSSSFNKHCYANNYNDTP